MQNWIETLNLHSNKNLQEFSFKNDSHYWNKITCHLFGAMHHLIVKMYAKTIVVVQLSPNSLSIKIRKNFSYSFYLSSFLIFYILI
jgi:hypothetical protein